MSLLRNDFGYLRWNFPTFLAHNVERSEYYVFVEETALVTPEGLTRPDGEPIDKDVFDVLRMRTWRIRASGIEVVSFHRGVGNFEELDHDNVNHAERQRRKSQLNETFGEEPLPIFDLYIGGKDEDFLFLRAILVPGSWYWIVVKTRSKDDIGPPIFVGAPELPAGPYAPGTLEFLETVPLSTEYRLRDIFSLIHVSDAEFGEEIGGEGEPLPPQPDDGSDAEEWQPSRQLHLLSLPMKSSET